MIMIDGTLCQKPSSAGREVYWDGRSSNPKASVYYFGLRRIAEVLLIVLFSPAACFVGLVISLAIWIETGRPILFVQERTGKYGKSFRMLKFRSMRVSNRQHSTLTTEGDTRLTGVGRFLRIHRLDELPQILNVLKGEMSIIGPRPEPRFLSLDLERHIPGYSRRRCVRPGLTGLAQIKQGYTDSIAETELKLEFDLLYITKASLGLDLKIMLGTLSTVLTGLGSR